MSKYTVNREGWNENNSLYKAVSELTKKPMGYFTTESEAIEFVSNGPYMFIEQRYPTQVIELLQRGEGWIAWDGSISLPPVNIDQEGQVTRRDGVITSLSLTNCWGECGNKTIIAYRLGEESGLLTNDRYINGERIELREGDYVEENMTKTKSEEIAGIFHRLFGSCYRDFSKQRTTKCGNRRDNNLRQLTLTQVLNAENAKPKEDNYDAKIDPEIMLMAEEFAKESAKIAIHALSEYHENDTPDPEWDGKNGELPSAGAKCQLSAHKSPYESGVVLFISHQLCVFKYDHGEEVCYFVGSTKFRPIQIPRERVIEKAKKIAHKNGVYSESVELGRMRLIEELHDAGMLIEGGE